MLQYILGHVAVCCRDSFTCAAQWASNRYLGPTMLVTWVLFTSVLILNIIVAVLCDAFAAVTIENEEFDEKGIKSVVDIFIESGLLGVCT